MKLQLIFFSCAPARSLRNLYFVCTKYWPFNWNLQGFVPADYSSWLFWRRKLCCMLIWSFSQLFGGALGLYLHISRLLWWYPAGRYVYPLAAMMIPHRPLCVPVGLYDDTPQAAICVPASHYDDTPPVTICIHHPLLVPAGHYAFTKMYMFWF